MEFVKNGKSNNPVYGDPKIKEYVLENSTRNRFNFEMGANLFFDVEDYWEIPDYRYETLHAEQDPRPIEDAQRYEGYDNPAFFYGHPDNPWYGTTRAERALCGMWDKLDKKAKKYTYRPSLKIEGPDLEYMTEGAEVTAEFFRKNEKYPHKPVLRIKTKAPSGEEVFFTMSIDDLVGFVQLFRENDCQRPSNLAEYDGDFHNM